MKNNKKGRTIAGFDQVAGKEKKEENNNSNINNDLIDNVINSNKPKSKTHIFKGYYLERELADTIDKITAGKPKGTKSDLVNDILKKYLIDNGLM